MRGHRVLNFAQCTIIIIVELAVTRGLESSRD
jgi:hypothetical protein